MTTWARPVARRGGGRARALVALLLILAAPFLLGQSASALRHLLLDAMENCLENCLRSLHAMQCAQGDRRKLGT